MPSDLTDANFRVLGSAITPKNITSTTLDFPFQIEGCAGYTANLMHALSIGLYALGPALQDVELSNRSPRFKAMFKDGSTKNFVRGILRGIARGDKLKGYDPDPKVPSAPRFACVSPTTVAEYAFLPYDPYDFCLDPRRGQAFWAGGSSYIFLCPSFWVGHIAPLTSNCPAVVGNHWAGGGQPLSMYLSYLLIHEMVHFYLGMDSLGGGSDPPEAYLINDCVRFNTYNSLHNPSNYQIYVALNQQGCTEAPDPTKPPFSQSLNKPGNTTALLSLIA